VHLNNLNAPVLIVLKYSPLQETKAHRQT